jgi:hypothetical protein
MTSMLDKLNLRPGERRLVIFGGLALFLVLNIWLVRPQFGKVSFWQNRRGAAQKKLNDFQTEINKKSFYDKELAQLKKLGGEVPLSDQGIQLQKDVFSYAALTGVGMDSSTPVQRQGSGGRTNAFFEEQTMQIAVTTGERELVDFLYNLGTRNSMIRVRTMNLQPDPSRMKLKGQVTLVASYQKKPPARSVTAATGTNKSASPKPAAPPVRTNPPATKTNVPVTQPTTTRSVPTTVKPASAPTVAATSKTNAVRPK